MGSLIKQMLRAAASGNAISGVNHRNTELDWVEENCLAGMLCYLTGEGEEQSLCASDQQLRGAQLTAKVITQNLISAMSDILDACKSEIEKIVLLKGVSICEQHYPLSYLRPMRDLDFLVLEKDLSRTEEILRQLGYQQKSDYPPSFYTTMHHSMPFYHPQAGIWVEVHTALFPAKSAIHASNAFCHNNVMQNLVKSHFNGHEVYRLSDELQLLYIAAHWCQDLRIVGGSIALFDSIYLLRNHPELDWERIFSWLSDELLATYLYTQLSYLKRHGILDIDDSFYAQLNAATSMGTHFNVKLLHRIIDQYLVAGKPFGSVLTRNNIGIVWKTLLRPRQPLINLLTLPVNIVFPPNNPRRFKFRFQYERIRSSIKLPGDN